MQAIIKSGSRQYQVKPETIIEVNRLPLEAGDTFETDQVLFYSNEGKDIKIGAPFVEGVLVKGKVLANRRGRKVLIFKMKRRKNYRLLKGHRQELTRIQIESIQLGGAKAKAPAAKAEQAPAEKAPKATTEKAPAEKAETKSAASTKKPAAKKPAAKKPAAKATEKAGE